MAAHAYWRMNFTQGRASAISIAEWKFYDIGASQIATTGGTASASSAVGGDPASSAFDGNSSTFWASSGAPPSWLQYQFASAVDPASFTIQNRGASNGDQIPVDVNVQFSDDGSTWTTLYSWYGIGWDGTLGQIITLNSTNAAPSPIGISWRLLITADQNGTQSTSIAEWKMYDAVAAQIATSKYAAITSSTNTEALSLDSGFFAFDGSLSTFWASSNIPSGGSPAWLAYRFASAAVYPASFSITARSVGTNYTQSPTTFSLQSSTDEVTWTTVQSYTSSTWTTPNQIQTFGVTSAPGPNQPSWFVVT